MNKPRILTASDIDVRIGGKNKDKTKQSLLFYKDARVDMEILDEAFGQGNWQADYKEIKGVMYCGIGVRGSAIDDKLPYNEWVWKWNAGVESKGTGEDDDNNKKGEASDAFKRAGFLWGIGRELYNCVNIWVDTSFGNYFVVKEIEFNDNLIPTKIVVTDTKGNIVYQLGKKIQNKPQGNVTDEVTPKEEKVAGEPKSDVKNENNITEDIVKEEGNKIYREIAQQLAEFVNNRGLSENFIKGSKVFKDYKIYSISEFVKKIMNDCLTLTLKTGWKKVELAYEERKPFDNQKQVLTKNEFLTSCMSEIDNWIGYNGLSGEGNYDRG